MIQKRGQFGNPKDFFSSKLWDDYVTGFGEPEKGKLQQKIIEDTRNDNNFVFPRVLAWPGCHLGADKIWNLGIEG